ncbi:MAG: hypothetical protein ACKOPT_12875 [Cyanobium sp.]
MARTSSIDSHIIGTYTTLRLGIGILAIALPIVLVGYGLLRHALPIQDSISAYYHAFLPTSQFPDVQAVAGMGLMRNWFVGILWAIGVFLFLYKGFGYRENTALNAAGILLILVAMFPMGWTCGNACPKVSIHGVSAILFFLLISYVCIFRSGDTLKQSIIPDPRERRRYQFWYRFFGIVMAAFPLIVTTLEWLQLRPFGSYFVLVLEVVGIITFACYWILKTVEIARSKADQAAIEGKLVRPNRVANPVSYWLDSRPLVERETPEGE